MIQTRHLAAAVATTAALASAGLVATAGAADASTVPACGNHSLAVSPGQHQGATGHSNLLLLFRNRSHQACSIYGYPGVDAITAHDHVLAHAKRVKFGFTGGVRHQIRTVVLRPGKYASADLEWVNFNPKTGGNCTYSHAIAVTPANTSHTVHLNRSVSICDLQIHPTVAGKSGNS